MKKLFLSLAVICSVAFVSCGGKKAEDQAQEAEATPQEEVVAADVATVADTTGDTVTVDTVVAVEAANVQ